MKSITSFHFRRRTAIASAAMLAMLLSGCGQDSILSPTSSGSSRLDRNGLVQNGAVTGTFSSDMQVIASKSIDRNGGTITGSRYTLIIPSRALKNATTITISERSGEILDADFGPAGTVFDRPVTLIMNYAGSNADPASPTFDGTQPAYYDYNASTGTWTKIPGTFNTAAKTFTVEINRFNPAMSGGSALSGGSAMGLPPNPNGGTADW